RGGQRKSPRGDIVPRKCRGTTGKADTAAETNRNARHEFVAGGQAEFAAPVGPVDGGCGVIGRRETSAEGLRERLVHAILPTENADRGRQRHHSELIIARKLSVHLPDRIGRRKRRSQGTARHAADKAKARRHAVHANEHARIGGAWWYACGLCLGSPRLNVGPAEFEPRLRAEDRRQSARRKNIADAA